MNDRPQSFSIPQDVIKTVFHSKEKFELGIKSLYPLKETPRAVEVQHEADILVGYPTYQKYIKDSLHGWQPGSTVFLVVSPLLKVLGPEIHFRTTSMVKSYINSSCDSRQSNKPVISL
jgi:hypothetical protein